MNSQGQMDQATFHRIVQLLLPYMMSERERRALTEQALYGSSLLYQIDWKGPALAFTVDLVEKALNYGDVKTGMPAIVVLLDKLSTLVGGDKRSQIDILKQALLHNYFKHYSGKSVRLKARDKVSQLLISTRSPIAVCARASSFRIG